MTLPSVHAIETAGLKCWPGLEVEWDGHWVRRATGGYTKRANSVQSLDASDDADASARIAAARTWFEARNIRPAFRATPLASPAVLDALDAAHWVDIDHSRVMAMELGTIVADPRATLHPPLDPAFVAAQALYFRLGYAHHYDYAYRVPQ